MTSLLQSYLYTQLATFDLFASHLSSTYSLAICSCATKRSLINYCHVQKWEPKWMNRQRKHGCRQDFRFLIVVVSTSKFWNRRGTNNKSYKLCLYEKFRSSIVIRRPKDTRAVHGNRRSSQFFSTVKRFVFSILCILCTGWPKKWPVVLFSIVAFKTLDISQGSVAIHLRCGGIGSDSIITNFLLILTVK